MLRHLGPFSFLKRVGRSCSRSVAAGRGAFLLKSRGAAVPALQSAGMTSRSRAAVRSPLSTLFATSSENPGGSARCTSSMTAGVRSMSS